MAIYTTKTIPAINTTCKVVTDNFAFTGREQDLGIGNITVSTIGRVVDADTKEPILSADGQMQYEGAGAPINLPIVDVLGTEIDGITGMDVLNWLGKWFDINQPS
jgi:hypothetical protein